MVLLSTRPRDPHSAGVFYGKLVCALTLTGGADCLVFFWLATPREERVRAHDYCTLGE